MHESTDHEARQAACIAAITRGQGLMPGDTRSPSDREQAFRAQAERWKDQMLAEASRVEHPALLTDAQLTLLQRNIEQTDAGREWLETQQPAADHVVAQARRDSGYIAAMIDELTPTNTYAFTCPATVGRSSQEAAGPYGYTWDYREPNVIRSTFADVTYPHPDFPETATLQLPRLGQTLSFYLNDNERAHPDDRSGARAWHFAGHPIHVSFSGLVRLQKVLFMMRQTYTLALLHRLTGGHDYARTSAAMLRRLADCFGGWAYHDYWDGFADCDPLYAAWHDRSLPLTWKRHLCEQAYAKDSLHEAAMMQTYWGAGRVGPTTGMVSAAPNLALAYDLIHDATDEAGRPVLDDAAKRHIERDLLLEYVLEGEHWLGGRGQAEKLNNMAPRLYLFMACVARVLGVADYAQVAQTGFEAIVDQRFDWDGMSLESPGYTSMYLQTLLMVAARLDGYAWPAGHVKQGQTLHPFHDHAKLRLVMRTYAEILRDDGEYVPLADTAWTRPPPAIIHEIGQQHYPSVYDGRLSALYQRQARSEYGIMYLDLHAAAAAPVRGLPERWFPVWMTGLARHGRAPDSSVLALTLSPPSGHRQRDCLSLYYHDRGCTMLGDNGYLGSQEPQHWNDSAQAHNLVIVDGQDQGYHERRTRLNQALFTPRASVLEGEAVAGVYDCRTYRRLVVLVKGPDGASFAIDVFRVAGGRSHDFRIHSELAGSDAGDAGGVRFEGLDMPAEPPLPQVGGSMAAEDIFGLRDPRRVEAPPPGWRAVWAEPDRCFRMWMLSRHDHAFAANMPAQPWRDRVGRRARVVGAVNEAATDAAELRSTFVAVHEPSAPGGELPLYSASLVDLPEQAGPDAVAVRIDGAWGRVWLFSDVQSEVSVDGIRFAGKLGLAGEDADTRRWLVAHAARTLAWEALGFADRPAWWEPAVTGNTSDRVDTDAAAPTDFPALPTGCTVHALVDTDDLHTGVPVRDIDGRAVHTDAFPLPPVRAMRVPAAWHIES